MNEFRLGVVKRYKVTSTGKGVVIDLHVPCERDDEHYGKNLCGMEVVVRMKKEDA